MNLETSIKDTITKKLEDGTVEKLVEEQLEKGITKALESLFGSYGDVTKTIETQIKSVMAPYLEEYDYSDYILKLDSVLTDVLKASTGDNKKILENFKSLITVEEKRKTIKVSELFDEWCKYVAKEVETDGLDVDYNDGASYQSVEVSFDVEYDKGRSWSSFEYATLIFECEHDEEMNFAIKLSKYNKSKGEAWDMSYDTSHEINSLRYLSEFEIFLMKLSQANVKIKLDLDSDTDDITPEAEPEASYS